MLIPYVDCVYLADWLELCLQWTEGPEALFWDHISEMAGTGVGASQGIPGLCVWGGTGALAGRLELRWGMGHRVLRGCTWVILVGQLELRQA